MIGEREARQFRPFENALGRFGQAVVAFSRGDGELIEPRPSPPFQASDCGGGSVGLADFPPAGRAKPRRKPLKLRQSRTGDDSGNQKLIDVAGLAILDGKNVRIASGEWLIRGRVARSTTVIGRNSPDDFGKVASTRRLWIRLHPQTSGRNKSLPAAEISGHSGNELGRPSIPSRATDVFHVIHEGPDDRKTRTTGALRGDQVYLA